jgi:hypothetical protein
MTLPRPTAAPKRIPLWAWKLDAWLSSGKQGPRPRRSPKRVPAWFWIWRLYTRAKHERQGSRAWKRYIKALNALPDPAAAAKELRARIVRWARYYSAHEPQVGYTQSTSRDDFLHEPHGHLPQSTDCSGLVTEVTWDGGGPDPSGFAYRYVGFTGTILSHAYRHGRVFTDLSQARPGDPIVIGPGTGWHAVLVLEAGHDPLVVSHGDAEGPKIYRCSVDSRQPKRVCQTLP